MALRRIVYSKHNTYIPDNSRTLEWVTVNGSVLYLDTLSYSVVVDVDGQPVYNSLVNGTKQVAINLLEQAITELSP